MNEINASKRLKESALQRAEGEKILKVGEDAPLICHKIVEQIRMCNFFSMLLSSMLVCVQCDRIDSSLCSSPGALVGEACRGRGRVHVPQRPGRGPPAQGHHDGPQVSFAVLY